MKTISKRFLKASVAMLLVVIMLMSSTITGLAAVVDNAQTKYDTSGTVTLYYDNSISQWSNVYFRIGHSGYNQAIKMTKVDGTTDIYTTTVSGWNGYEAFNFANSYGWTNNNSIYENHIYTAATVYKKFKLEGTYMFIGQSSSVGTAGDAKYISCYGVTGNGTDGDTTASNYTTYQKKVSVESVSGGTVTATYSTGNGGTISEGSDATILYGSTITVNATADSGYAAGNITVTNAENTTSTTLTSGGTCEVTGSSESVVTAEFERTSSTVTVNAGEGGSVNPSGSQTVDSSLSITATPDPGYDFVNWTSSNGGTFANANSASTTFTPSGDATITANFQIKTFTATFLDTDQESVFATKTVEYGKAPGAPATSPTWECGSFSGWASKEEAGSSWNTGGLTPEQPIYGDITYYSTFTNYQRTYSVTAGEGGIITSSNTSGTVNCGDSIAVKAEPTSDKYEFSEWQCNVDTSWVISPSDAETELVVHSDVIATAIFKVKTFDVDITVDGDLHGTILLNGEETTSTTVQYGTNLPLVITPETGYAVNVTINGVSVASEASTYNSTISNITSNQNITVEFVDVRCQLEYTTTNVSLCLGETYTNSTLTKNDYCVDSHSITYFTNDTDVLTVNQTTGEVTVVGSGTAIVYAVCDEYSSTAEYTVTVLDPTITLNSLPGGLKMGNTSKVTLSGCYDIENAPASAYTVDYTIVDGEASLENGVITFTHPGDISVQVDVKFNGKVVATETITFTVSGPTTTASLDSVKLYRGHDVDVTLTLDDDYYNADCTIVWSSDSVNVVVTDNTTSANIYAGINTGSATVTATITYATGYQEVVEIAVDVITPTITPSKSSLSLDYGVDASSPTGTFTVSTNLSSVSGSCDEDDNITVSTQNSSVATATISGTTVTVNAKGLGSTNVVISFHGETKTVPVTVKEAESWEYIYVTDNLPTAWGSMKLYYWNEGGGDTTVDMVKIGTNSDSDSIFAYRFKKGNTPDWFILKKTDEWGDHTCTEQYAYASTGYYFTDVNADLSTDSDSTARENLSTWTVHLSLPTVSVDASDITMAVGETQTVTATHSGASTKWVIDDTSIVTASSTTSKTPTFTGKAKGRTTATVYAIASTSGTSFTSFNTSSTAALPYIAGSATVNVKVTRAADDTNITIYLSSGRQDMGVTLATTLDDMTATETVSGTCESYNEYDTTFQTVDITTTLSSSDFMVDSFVVYKIESRTYEIYEANEDNSTTYTASTDVLIEDCYIYPVVFHSDSYFEANSDLEELEFYFEAPDLDFDVWGPFVSCYAYGSQKFFGEWTGQLMIPTEDGKSFYTKIAIDKDNPSNLTGVVFNNGVFTNNETTLQTNIHKLYSELGLKGNRNIQTYDYREAKTLFSQGYSSITFVMKKNLDGYHGDYPDSTNNQTYKAGSSINALDKGYGFDYLYRRDGKTLMDLNGNAIETVSATSSPDADYYVVTKGDVTWGYTGASDASSEHVHPNGFDGYWAVTWYIYDSTGAYLGKGNSDYLWYKDSTDDLNNEFADVLIANGKISSYEDFAGKVVKISYEAGNQCPETSKQSSGGDNQATQYSYDGQWYGTNPYDTMHANVIVGLENEDGSWTLTSKTPTNDDDYGTGYLVTADGLYAAEEDITIADGDVELTATAKEHYKFVGWYTSKDVRLTENYDYKGYINNDTTYYAIFKRLGTKEVVISHSKYNNTYEGAYNDTIRPHNGDAQLLVEVFKADGETLYETGYTSTTRSQVSFEAEDDQTYIVKISTTPLRMDTFFAWYTDSLDADGNPTYEEMMTRGEDVGKGKGNTITTTFVYESNSGIQQINVYSDLVKVSANATLEYHYYNRYGALRVVTETVKLSDEEMDGFAGNDTKPYHPEYKNYWFSGDKNTAKRYYTEDDATNAGLNAAELDTANNITNYAPNYEVTEAVHQNIQWTMEDLDGDGAIDRFESSPSLAVLYANQATVEYTINYTIGDNVGYVTAEYNTLLDIEAPDYDGEIPFSYWMDSDTGEIISYNRYYAYRIVEDRNIEAVYGATDYDPWTSVIENVTQTREYQNKNELIDLVYVDFLLAFHNSSQLRINDLGDEVQYGLVMVREDGYEVTADNYDSASYPADADKAGSIIESKVETVVTRDLAAARFKNDAGTYFYATHYNLSGSQNVTNLNRLNFVLSFNNDGTEYYKHAYSTYAYIIADGVTYISEVEPVNIYETATTSVTQ